MKINEFLKGLPSGAPICCFGARIASLPLLDFADFCGRDISSQGRLVVSGGAKGLDSAFVGSFDVPKSLYAITGEYNTDFINVSQKYEFDFIKEAHIISNSKFKIFYPVPGSAIPGLFARSRSALEFTKSNNGGAIVMLSREKFEAKSGGSYYSLNYALKLNMPVLRVLFSLPDESNNYKHNLSHEIIIPQMDLFS